MLDVRLEAYTLKTTMDRRIRGGHVERLVHDQLILQSSPNTFALVESPL